MNILITGGAGYVGSVLIPSLIKGGHKIKCLDRFFFGDEFLSSSKFSDNLELIKDDIRWFDPEILKNVDLVFDLAALSNDPVGDLDPQKTYEINHLGRVRVATLSKKMGVPQYILASSASIYGQQSEIADETSTVFPITTYSKANRKAEIDVLKLDDSSFAVSCMRFSSIYGTSPRMRFDISVNSMILDLFKTGKIVVRGMSNSRPFLHIQDAVKAYQMILEAPKDKIRGEIFNIGSDDQNYKIGNLAKEIASSIDEKCELELGDNKDFRSYTVSFKKIRDVMGFETDYTIKDCVIEMFDDLKNNKIQNMEKSITLKWYNQIKSDPKLFEKFQINGQIL
jgi:nucleoside-diphosphate-sugar epimerase